MILFIKKQKNKTKYQTKKKTPKHCILLRTAFQFYTKYPELRHSVNKCSIVSMFNLQNLQRGESINLI